MEECSDAGLRELLHRFGLERFRPGQEEVIRAVLSGADVLAVMPTGGGKSLCYQLPSLARPGMTLVISPLIALMQDQTEALHQRGIRATQINSSLTTQEQQWRLEQMAAGAYDLVYVAPERMRHSAFLRALESVKVELLAVDEAHCVSEWGHDFRPDYARIGTMRQEVLGNVQTIALTATATPLVRQDICRLLGLREPQQFITGFARPNLQLRVSPCADQKDKDEQLRAFLRTRSGSGIIYAATRKRCDELAEWLPQQLRRSVGVYHAGLPVEQRQSMQQAFMSGDVSAIVATNAFGMGVDKRDLRWVVHYNLPGSVEAYYQEAGRAGRDGIPSECLLLFQYSDRYIQEFFIENRYPTAEVVQRVYEFLSSRQEDPIELTLEEVRQGLQINKVSAEAVGTAESLLSKSGVLQRLESGGGYATLRIDSRHPTLVDLLPREAKVRRKVLQHCEKIVGQRRGEDVPFRLDRLIERVELERESVLRALRELSRLQDFDFVPPFRGRAIHFRRRGVPFRELKIDFDELDRRKAAEYEKLESVLRLCRTTACRQRTILDYFGEQHLQSCGVCDNCQAHQPPRAADSHGIDAHSIATVAGGGSVGLTERLGAVAQAAQQTRVRTADLTAYREVCGGVLQAVSRTHGRIGKGLTAQVLAGSQSQKLKGLRLHRAADFGKLRGLRQPEITQLLDQLLHAGLLEQREVNQHRPTLYVTDTGLKAIADPEQLPALLKLPPGLIARAAAAMRQSAAQTVGQRTASATDSVESPQSASADLASRPAAAPELVQRRLAELRRWRRETADQLGIPAYRVLPTTAVERLANDVPDSLSALARLPGIAPEIVAQWGAEILQLLQSIAEDGPALCDGPDVGRSHLDERSPDRPPESDASSPAPRTAGVADALPDATDARHRAVTTHGARPVEWTVRLLADGYAWMEVLSARRLTSGQAIGELERLAETGIALAPERLPSVQELREQWAREGEAVKVEATWDDLVGRLHRLRARFAALAASNAGVRQAGD